VSRGLILHFSLEKRAAIRLTHSGYLLHLHLKITCVIPEFIDTADGLADFCQRILDESLIAFDTEFVAEDSYKPELCLLQVATRNHLAIIDTLACGPVDEFWEILATPGRDVVVHAGREELLFCHRAIDKTIPKLFDIQIAAAFLGAEYPASYGNLVLRYTGHQLDKQETRSDWRRRPLSQRQLNYAAQDVTHLPGIFDDLTNKLAKKDRLKWAEEEMAERQSTLLEVELAESWYRLGGVQGLSTRSQAIARRLWIWRENKAQESNKPARRVLRDDLLIELAKRGSSDTKRIATLRGMNHRHLRNYLDELASEIEQASQDPSPDWPKRRRMAGPQPTGMLTQFLGAAMAQICRHNKLAPSIVGTTEDLKNFAMYELTDQSKSVEQPKLMRGWRRAIVASELSDLLSGRLGLVIDNPLDDIPIRFCRLDDSPPTK
jgi:ribonuclease D